jgi:hypothetical protein
MRIARWGAGVIIALVGASSFTLSFSALRGLAVEAHVSPQLALLLPVIVDGTIVLATLGWLVLANRPQRRFFLWLLVAGAATSVAGNSVHAVTDGRALPWWACLLVAAVAPLSLLADTHGVAVLARVAAVKPAAPAPRKRAPAARKAPPRTRAPKPVAVVDPPVAELAAVDQLELPLAA